MEPENIRFGGGALDSVLHPLVAFAVLVAIILILCLPRKYVIVPLLLAILSIPYGQVIVVMGLHFTMDKVLVLVGLVRWARTRKSWPPTGGFNSIDRLFVLWALSLWIMFSLQWMQAQAAVKGFADLLEAMGSFFVLRFLIRDREDVRRTIETLAVVAIVMAVCMLNEQRTGSNIFGLLGGLPPESMRDGHVRSQAAFEVFITAGAFGATLPPLLAWLWANTKSKMLALLGFVGAIVMAVTCFASTTLLSCVAGIFALCFWPFRKRMRLVRWGLAASLVALHLVMNGPVWSLLEKVDLTGSSSSYHRYMLIDNFIRHFGDWWLFGTHESGKWGWDMWDTSNQFVAHGENGGLLTLIFFIAIIARCFGRLGTARKRSEGNRGEEWFFWCLGSALFAHLVAYFGILYFDQMQFAWYALIAIISVSTVPDRTKVPTPQAQEAPPPNSQPSDGFASNLTSSPAIL